MFENVSGPVSTWNSWIAAALVLAAFPGRASGHGQQVVPVRISVENSQVFDVLFSFDAAWVVEEEGVLVDRKWLNSRGKRELEGIGDQSVEMLKDALVISLGGVPLDGDYRIPDLDVLPREGYDNGEPEGHWLIEFSGSLPPGGGALAVSLAEGYFPSAVVTTVVDGKALRRLAVLLQGEEKELTTLDPPEAVPPGDGGVAGGSVGDHSDLLFGEGVDFDGGTEPLPPPGIFERARGAWEDGFFTRASPHWIQLILGVALFLGACRLRDLGIFLGCSLVGALVSSIWRAPGRVPESVLTPVLLGAVAVLLVAGVRGGWWKLAAGIGAALASGMLALDLIGQVFPDSSTAFERAAVALGGESKKGAFSIATFVCLGWAWGESYFRRVVLWPAATVTLLAALWVGFAG